MVTAAEILNQLSAEFTLLPDPSHARRTGRNVARRRISRCEGGIIASVTRPFCGDCEPDPLPADARCATACSAATSPICGPRCGTSLDDY